MTTIVPLSVSPREDLGAAVYAASELIGIERTTFRVRFPRLSRRRVDWSVAFSYRDHLRPDPPDKSVLPCPPVSIVVP